MPHVMLIRTAAFTLSNVIRGTVPAKIGIDIISHTFILHSTGKVVKTQFVDHTLSNNSHTTITPLFTHNEPSRARLTKMPKDAKMN